MITQQDLRDLDEWSLKGETTLRVREWHAQLIVELIDYIHLLERNLGTANNRIVDLEETLRFMQRPLGENKNVRSAYP